MIGVVFALAAMALWWGYKRRSSEYAEDLKREKGEDED